MNRSSISGIVKQVPAQIKKKTITQDVMNYINNQSDYNAWVKNYHVACQGDEPDTYAAFKIPFEQSGIKPYGWNVNPYDTLQYTLDQTGLSLMFSDVFYNQVRYCHTENCWYVFKAEKGWICDKSNQFTIRIVLIFRGLLQYALCLIDDKDFRAKFKKCFTMQLANATQIKNFLELVANNNSFSASEMDTRIDILSVQNGVIQLHRDGHFDFHAFRAEDMTTRHMATNFDPNAKCDRWSKFIGEVLNGNQEIIHFFKIFLGQSLFGCNDQKAFGIFYGEKTNNGKSTLISTLRGLFGDYSVTVNESLIQKKNNITVGDLAELAKTKGTRLVALPEPTQGLQIDVAGLKNITGRAPVSARFLHQNAFDFTPGFTLIIDTNHELMMRDLSIFKRGSVVLFQFDQTFKGANMDTQLEEKLRKEFPGILNWLLEGWTDYCAACPDGMPWTLPQAMQQNIQNYWHRSDLVRLFLEDNYVFTGDRSDVIKKQDVYQHYRDWSIKNGDHPKSNKAIQSEIGNNLGLLLGLPNDTIPERKIGNGIRCYYGIKLKDSDDEVIHNHSKMRKIFRNFIFKTYEPSKQTTDINEIYKEYQNAISNTQHAELLLLEECIEELNDLTLSYLSNNSFHIIKRDPQQMYM